MRGRHQEATTFGGGSSLPPHLTKLERLHVFHYYDIHLCEPQDAVFPAWLAGIRLHHGTGIPCADPVYLPVIAKPSGR